MSDIKLPELPQWCQWDETVADMSTFDIQDAMQDYARAAVIADREAIGAGGVGGERMMQPASHLTDERIKEIDNNTPFHESPEWSVRFARAVIAEAAQPASVPSDDDLETLAKQYLSAHAQFVGSGDIHVEGEIDYARAVLAKYGNTQELSNYKAEIARLNKQIHALADALDFGADFLIDSDGAEDAARLFALANNFYIKGPDDDGLLWLVLRGNGTSGQAMFNLGGAECFAGQVALMLEQDRCAAIDAARGREVE